MNENKMINFDPTSWDSIENTISKINEIGEMQFGETEDGEDIFFDLAKDEDGNDCLVTEVFQSNGWIRKNIYNPATCRVEEMYRKE